jgi:glycosyltransferase involved in cell wall biosynthesis
MSRPKDIVILNDHASLTGGSAAVAIASAKGLAARSHRVTLVTCVGPVAPELKNVPNLEVICLGQHEIAKDPNRLRSFTSGIRNSDASAVVRAVLRDKARASTVVHVHSWTKALSPFALAAASSMGFPLVVTLHDFFITCPSGGFFVHGPDKLCGRAPLSTACVTCNCDRRNYTHKLWRTARTVIQNKVLRVPEKVAHFVGVSNHSLGLLKPHLPSSVPVTMVRNPLECPDLGPAAAGSNRAFVFIGRFEEEKGVRLFAQAVRETGLPAVFIGDGALAPEIKRLCPRSEFTGWIGPAAIRAHLAKARALVFPPLWYETLGLVVVEAAAAGVPAIVADRCAATDVVENGSTGVFFKHGDAAALADAMRSVAADDGLTGRLGMAAYNRYWSDPWTVERHVGKLLEIYENLAEVS